MSAALITLRNGYSYAASDVKIGDGFVRAQCRRYKKVGPNNERTRFYGALLWRSWPREAVAEVRAVEPWGEAAEGAQTAPAAS